jgi:DNA adenine methylase
MMNKQFLRAPFPWFGGKSRVASVVWQRFGDVEHYVEPFAGSLAVLLGRPNPEIAVRERSETVNDKDCYLVNFWRAVRADPDAVIQCADWPVTEADLYARNVWLIEHKEALRQRLFLDPEFYDAKCAGWWVWGLSSWLGAGWCSQICQKLPMIATAGQGVHSLTFTANPQLWLSTLQARLRRVRIACGDWARVVSQSVGACYNSVGIFLDPPYSDDAQREDRIYAEEDTDVAHAVREWAITNGENPKYRIALCGYEGEHEMPDSWECYAWSTTGGFGNLANGRGKENRHRERIWFSPHCLRHPSLFD